jgi:hypothetical protein
MSTASKPWKRWADTEDTYLRQNYAKGEMAEMAFTLGRSATAVRTRAKQLGLKRTTHIWSEADLEILRREYSRLGPVGVSQLVNRHPRVVLKTAHRLGIKRKYPWTTRQDCILRQRYPMEGASEELSLATGKNRKMIHHRAGALGLSYIGPHKNLGRNAGRNSIHWMGVSDPDDSRFDVPATVMKILRRNACARKIPITLTLLDIWNLLRAQRGCCAKTGRSVSFTEGTASIDRIDSDGPYSPENIRITTIMANLCQLYYTDAEMDQFCLDYVRHKGLLTIPAKDAEAEAAASQAATTAAPALKEAA